MQLRQLITNFTDAFAAAGIESARADAEILVAEILGLSRGELAVFEITGRELSADEVSKLQVLADRRAAREPLQHLTGRGYFRNLTLQVGKGVFVPRPETELIAQLAIDALNEATDENLIAVDLCTGSGAIALAMATEVPKATVHAVELSEDAIFWASKNFATYVAQGAKANLVQGDLVTAFPELNGQVSVLATNPPYIPAAMVPIYPEVHLHDPALALYSGEDGLDAIRGTSQTGLRLLKSGGFFVVEHADIQSDSVIALLSADGWLNATAHQDLNGRNRAVSAIRP
jgi:release factor glutamine methyltransferase